MRATGLFCVASLVLAACPVVVQAEAFGTPELSLGAYAATGDYGSGIDTSLGYMPLSLALERGAWRGQLTTSRLVVEGPGSVLVNLGGVTRAFAAEEVSWRRGTGDALLELGYTQAADSSPSGGLLRRSSLTYRLIAKLPTASVEKGLGTGELDVSLQIDGALPLASSVVFASVGYSDRGASSLYPDILSSGFAQLGVARRTSARTSVGLLYDFRETASSLYADAHEASLYGSLEFDRHWTLTGLVSAGLNESSADAGLYFQLSYRW